ncbi:MAG: hypothetical protein HPY73_01670 [Methanomassiliicoccales archaeon]|nr:MAG: hypothetical protein HPY73_01670 [Methanomassiliicoccales archaeon]
MTGCDMNTSTWKVDELFVTVPKATAKEMKIKTGLFKRSVTIKVKTDQVGVVGDVIQLNIDFATLQKHLTS